MIVGNLRCDLGSGLPMSGFTKFLSGNLGDSEAACGFELSGNGVL